MRLVIADIIRNVKVVRQKLATKGVNEVTIIAVAKTFSSDAVQQAVVSGITNIGENYLQEALVKIEACKDCPIQWHFLGAIQSNKTKTIAQYFDWVHSVDRFSIARRLSMARYQEKDLNVLIQVNVDDEESKSGVKVDEVLALSEQILTLPKLKMRGLMCVPAEEKNPKFAFEKMLDIQKKLAISGIETDVLSMGMSNDYLQAVEVGATHIRLGRALFGARERKEK